MSNNKTAKLGRPTKYSEALADKICTRISSGHSLRKVAKAMAIDESVVYDWLRKYPEFTKKYAHAREWQADLLADEVLEIANEPMTMDVLIGGEMRPVVSMVAVKHARLRIDARKWYVSKLAPKKYGNRLNATVSRPNDGPVQVQVKMTDAECVEKLAFELGRLEREESHATADRLAASPAERIDVGSIPSDRTSDSTH